MSQTDISCYEYATVYLLDCPYFIDKTYDYFIPPALRGEVDRGCFVTVPFGRSNRRQMALVWSLVECPSYSEAKPIDAVCTDRLPLSEEMLRLCEFMKEQCLCTMGEAVRCAVPASALGKMCEFYYPIPSASSGALSDLAPADLFVYDYLVSTGGKTLDSLKAKFGAAAADNAIRLLVSTGLVGKELLMGKTASDAFQNYYSLAITEEECREILEGRGIKLRSPIHKAILAALLKAGSLWRQKHLRKTALREALSSRL